MTCRTHGPMALLVLLGALPLPLLAQPAPPDLRQLAPLEAASAPAAAPVPKRRCVAGCGNEASARITHSEDALNRFEEHRNARGELVQLFVIPKSGAPRYEVLVGTQRNRDLQLRSNPNAAINAQQREGQAVWQVGSF